MESPCIYIWINKSLGMSAGKIAAQAAHAAMLVQKEDKDWGEHPQRTILVCEARDSEHMRNIQDYLGERNYLTQYVIDEGINEIEPMSFTAMSSEVVDRSDEEAQKVFGQFKLYRDTIRISMEVDR